MPPRAAAPPDLDAWTTLVRREKAIYHTLNKCNVDVTRKVRAA